VGVRAVVALWTLLVVFDGRTESAVVVVTVSFAVFGVVVVGTLLVVMGLPHSTRVDLENFEVELLNVGRATLTKAAV